MTPADRDPRDRTSMMHDVVTEHGLNPVVLVLTRSAPAADSPAAKLAKDLNPLVTKHKGNNFAVSVVFLTLEKEYPQDERYVENDPNKGFVREAQAQAVKGLATTLAAPKVVYGLAAVKSAQTDAWGMGDGETLVVLYHRMQVVKRWEAKAGQPLGDDVLKQVVAAADATAGGK
jgi:hypothetical protein